MGRVGEIRHKQGKILIPYEIKAHNSIKTMVKTQNTINY